ncbi:HAD-superfamily hydrolase, subfamily IA, variant 1 family protein [Oceanicola granulosus HTCC2516]|uniref:HAD-superfamily hydrolase, subfamily IA, variant 1 family protein n=1 Tax=Oceanicola granulosus (strain ATCC BAA-861 / DSM 15982 / KCTC 12143 / HTCC2516) TaxID=314256 RepID=Q2CBC0_OCEGH|nr:HAD family phosphatase [Oceanicola granulosus]EAR49978.1 HAD-superfamily hydrolase, subfamily IA, variant 1 family protein [Oceanicola granulosus HTCC2516]
MTIEAVVFDIGNVLIHWNPERFFDEAVGEARRREMFDKLDLHGMNERVDRGAHFGETIMAFAADNPEFADEIVLWHDRWIELASPAIDHSVRLLRALRRHGTPCFALSNFGVQTFEMAEMHYPFFKEFDRRYISGQMGVIKPSPEIYAAVEADCGLPPGSLLFTDDRADNIAAAEERGWQVHHFTRPEGLARRLVREGLLKASEAE